MNSIYDNWLIRYTQGLKIVDYLASRSKQSWFGAGWGGGGTLNPKLKGKCCSDLVFKDSTSMTPFLKYLWPNIKGIGQVT